MTPNDAVEILLLPQLIVARATLINQICYYYKSRAVNYRLRDVMAMTDLDLIATYQELYNG